MYVEPDKMVFESAASMLAYVAECLGEKAEKKDEPKQDKEKKDA